MNAIVIADSNWGITCNGKPIASIPAERKSRMQEIAGKVIVYGVKHIDDLPGQQPVKGCINMIYTDNMKCNIRKSSEVFSFDTLDELRKALGKYNSGDIYVIDNEKLYREFLKDFTTVHVTKIDYSYNADSFFENLDKNEEFVITADSEEQYCFDIVYNFYKYERRK